MLVEMDVDNVGTVEILGERCLVVGILAHSRDDAINRGHTLLAWLREYRVA